MVDAARGLVDYPHQRDGRPAARTPRPDERGGDAVQKQDIGPAPGRRPEHSGTGQCGKRERPGRKGDEFHSGTTRGRQRSNPPVIQIAAGHRLWVAQGYEGNVEDVRVIHVVPTPPGTGGLFGGGERYPLELARVLARYVDCMLVTFGPSPRTWREPNGLRILMLRRLGLVRGHPVHPVAPQLPWSLRPADAVYSELAGSGSAAA
jgi:hypothetical protein